MVQFALASAVGYCIQMLCSVQFGGLPMLIIGVTLGNMSLTAQTSMNSYFYTRFFGLKGFAETYGIHMAFIELPPSVSPRM